MQRLEAEVGDIFWVGNQPVGLSMAHGGRVVMWTPNCLEESEEDLRRTLERQKRRQRGLTVRRHLGKNSGNGDD